MFGCRWTGAGRPEPRATRGPRRAGARALVAVSAAAALVVGVGSPSPAAPTRRQRLVYVARTIPVSGAPFGVTVRRRDGARLYVSNSLASAVTVIDTATNAIVTSIPTGTNPEGLAIRPDNARVLVANNGSGNLSVLDTETNMPATNPFPVGPAPTAVAVTSDGARVYVTNQQDNTVSVIEAATNTVVTPAIRVGTGPVAAAVADVEVAVQPVVPVPPVVSPRPSAPGTLPITGPPGRTAGGAALTMIVLGAVLLGISRRLGRRRREQ